jgi:hypothetical protein
MPRWRKATWALLIWTALMGIWIAAGIGAVSNSCDTLAGQALETCQAGVAVGGGLGVTFIIIIWFIGFIVLGLIWLMSRPKDNVLIYGPDGQQVNVSEKEAKRRLKKGWTYQPKGEATQPTTDQQ